MKRESGPPFLFFTLLTLSAGAAEDAMFPFVISYDAPNNITNVSAWLPRPAGGQGFVRVKDGHFATDAGPIRFWATNLCFEACFPPHDVAERVAVRLARLGINCVRFHHMDSHSIWGKSKDKTTIDPEKLERLDYLIYQLKLHGVYVNLNLHVSRWLDEREGFPHRDQRPHYDKGLGNFEPRMIELQKKYARDLLTHVNPYTKTPYVAEPAVAFVEISNEDALFAEWGWGSIDRLPDPYATTFRKLWNAWLRKKYQTTEALARTWNVGSQALGEEMLTNGDFSKPIGAPWHLEVSGPAKAAWSVAPDGPGGKPFLRVVVEKMGDQAWIPQFTHVGLAVKKEQVYTLTFQARSDKPRRIHVNCMMAHEPWGQLGFYAAVELTAGWKPYRLSFIPNASDDNARITFTNLEPGTLDLAAVSLRPGGIVGLEPGQRLDDDSVPVVKHGQMSVTAAARNDFVDFLWDTERDYWWDMYRFLKDELKCQPLVAGTQAGYSPLHIQAGLDYVDAHSYWQHPHFPGRPWDFANWWVGNVALVNSPAGTLGDLAARRVAGKPYTVSEYNHPMPNQFAAEGMPMIAAVGAFQGWDAVYSFGYNHNLNFEPRRIEGFFDIKADPAKLAHSIACAAMLLRGDVKAGTTRVFGWLPREREREALRRALNAWGLKTGEDERRALVNWVGIALGDAAPPMAHIAPLPKDQKVFASESGEIRWDASEKGAGFFTVSAPRVKVFTGFVRGRTFDLGHGVSLAIGKTALDWATLTMTCIDGEGCGKPGRILIAATGDIHNKGAKLRDLGGSRVTLSNQWGDEPVLCEGVPAEITLPADPDRVKLYPLDERGNRREAVPLAARDGKALLRLGPEHKTIWYEAELR